MCLLEDSQPVCYCVPDYHGQLCEQRYDDCESKFATCENGGTCIDGINNFTCSCPSEYSGEMCHEYNPTTTMIATIEEDVNATMKTVPLPTMIYSTSQQKTTKSSLSTKFYSETPTSSSVDREEEFSTTSSINLEGTTLSSSKNSSSIEAYSETDFLTKTFSTIPIIDLDSTTTTRIYLTALTSVTSGPAVTVTSLERDSTDFPTSSISYEVSDSTPEIETKSSITPDPISLRDTSTFFQPESLEPLITTESPITSPDSSTKSSNETHSTISETSHETPGSGDEQVTTFPTNVITDEPVEETPRSFSTAGTLDEETTEFVGENVQVTTMEMIDLSNDTIDTLSTRFFLVTPSTKGSKDLEPSEEISHDSRTTQSSRYDCSQEECLITNCPKNSSQCDCKTRDKCKDGPSIENAAFNGKSYLRQQVNIEADGSLRIFIRLKTKSKSGVLVHAFFDDERYVLLYMEGGQLKFQFSCGLQTMLLGEIDSPINNGFDVDVEMR